MNRFLVVWGACGFGNDAKFFDDYDLALSFACGLSNSILADIILIYEWDNENDQYEFLQEI